MRWGDDALNEFIITPDAALMEEAHAQRPR